MSTTEEQGDSIMSIPGAQDRVDPEVFDQITDMDENKVEREFSKGVVYDFFQQAVSTFSKMDQIYANREDNYLKTLSELGHFLKGSSATLGLVLVKDECEKIQNFGLCKDETGITDISEDDSRQNLGTSIAAAKKQFTEVTPVLRTFYGEDVTKEKTSPYKVQ